MQFGCHQALSILVVEDDPAVSELLRVLVNDMPGWGAVVVHDGAAAYELLKHIKVDVLVCDVNLPTMSGLELVDRVAHDSRWQHVPVILISANSAQPGIEETVRRWAHVQFMPKPFDVEALLEAIQASTGKTQPLPSQPRTVAA